jgi:toxin ParE1/3/4
MHVSWTPRARAEREAAIDYIAQDNPLAALDQLDEIEQQTSLLNTQPKMGRVGRVKGTRELVINRTPFIAVYRIEGNRIEVLRFLHGAQKWPLVPQEKRQ